jgi:hypothetical protein
MRKRNSLHNCIFLEVVACRDLAQPPSNVLIRPISSCGLRHCGNPYRNTLQVRLPAYFEEPVTWKWHRCMMIILSWPSLYVVMLPYDPDSALLAQTASPKPPRCQDSHAVLKT